jgi:uncharacterized membrane protein (UPF0182 family)
VTRSLRWLLPAAFFLLFVGLPSMAGVYTDWLWFGETGYRRVFVTELATRGWLWAAALVVAFATLAFNLRHALVGLPPSPVLWVGQPAVPVTLPGRPQLLRLVFLVSAIAAMPLAFQAAGAWLPVQMWLNAVPFGQRDPILGHDVAFYMFTLPVAGTLGTWLLLLLALSAIGSLAVYVLGGRVGMSQHDGLIIAPHVRRHLAVLAAATFLVLAFEAWLSPPRQLVTGGPLIFGASCTDVAIRIPAARVLLAVCLLGIVASIASARGSLTPLVAAVAIYIVTAIGGEFIASQYQRFGVGPNEQARETPYMAHNIASTRAAFALDRVAERELTGDATLDADDIKRNLPTLTNVRLWDHRPLLDTFSQLQEIRPYYDFVAVDNDRYIVNREYRQVMLSARELNSEALSNRTWINEHLTFTHGFGLTLGPVNQVTSEGLPVLFVKDLPPVSTADLTVAEPRLYFGELSSEYVFVGTRAVEFDYPRGDDNVVSRYQGRGGIPVDSFWRKLLFALRFRSQQILFSNDLGPETRILFRRQVDQRMSRIAPFLLYEGDPYLVVVDGRLLWIEDAYTTSAGYPYSTPVSRDVNYIRNSVKVVVDAYHGTVTFYQADAQDPIARTLGRVFPDLFKPIDAMPAGLRAHVRYPHQLFSMQTAVYATYHMTNPAAFYNKEDQWQLPTIDAGTEAEPMEPYYTIMKLPGEARAEFIQMVPLTPRRKDNLAAWMVARSDAPSYGQLMVFRFPKQKVVFGPRQVVARINQDQEISPQITLWNQQGSEVIQGTLLVIPIEESLLYIRPLYLRAQGGKIPELKRVIVAYQGTIVMEPTLEHALARLFGAFAPGAPAVTPGAETPAPAGPSPAAGPAPSAGTPGGTALSLALAEARDHYERAVAAQRAGDWAKYGEELRKLGDALGRASASAPKR